MVINLRKSLIGAGGAVLLIALVYLLGSKWLASSSPRENREPVMPRAPLADRIAQVKYSRAFFSEYRLERERIRSEQVDLLREMINNPNVDGKAKESAAARLVKITEAIDREVKAETLVKATGYQDCVVISQSGITMVVVPFKAASLPLGREEELKKQVAQVVGCQADEVCIIVRKSEG